MRKINTYGFTLVEFILVIGILIIMIAIGSIGVSRIRTSASINTSVTTLIANIKAQQLKSMVGDTEGRTSPDTYGIYMNGNVYTLFHGNIYSAAEPTNFDTSLGENIVFSSVSFPGSEIVFDTKSGEIIGFSAPNNQITLKDNITNEQVVITINSHGVVTSVQ